METRTAPARVLRFRRLLVQLCAGDAKEKEERVPEREAGSTEEMGRLKKQRADRKMTEVNHKIYNDTDPINPIKYYKNFPREDFKYSKSLTFNLSLMIVPKIKEGRT
uniref:Uncharacterized protein n=1 Tax=Oryza brachyantha TaxID=4533 RepID=J3M6B4_ORYBR